ncbi:MAG TPA: J domain-containing protein, partial [Anaerolineales bacterium]|nr:J domain-containing protein [Anaerolineales bacterium]
DGAPQPIRQLDISDLPPNGLFNRQAIRAKSTISPAGEQDIPDIKVLYRKLARRYHPDLARNEGDRAASNAQMVDINRAYNAGDLKTLLRLAGIGLPYGVELPESQIELRKNRAEPLSEQDKADLKLKAIRQLILRMSSLPIIKLSLEVKLAQHQGRNLLREMAAGLQYKVGRKLAERDYLQAQINTHAGDV